MGNIIYLVAVVIFASGLLIMLISNDYIKKIIGLGIFQSSVLVFYIALGKVDSGIPPILVSCKALKENAHKLSNFGDSIVDAGITACTHSSFTHLYSSPVPHVLMLTAIVVGFATLSVGLALIYTSYTPRN